MRDREKSDTMLNPRMKKKFAPASAMKMEILDNLFCAQRKKKNLYVGRLQQLLILRMVPFIYSLTNVLFVITRVI